MSAPLRFLGLAVVGYIGLRAASSAFALAPMADIPIPPPATPLLDMLAPEPPPEQAYAEAAAMPMPAAPQSAAPMLAPGAMPMYVPYPVAVPYMPEPRVSRAMMPRMAEAPAYEQAVAQPFADDWLAPIGAAPSSPPQVQATPSWTGRPQRLGSRRLQLTVWGLLRQPSTDLDAPATEPSLAPTGTLGGSQTGGRLTYRVNDRLTAGLRFSTPLDAAAQESGGFAGEAALGISWAPVRGLPVRLTAERRKAFGTGAGRDAFAFFAEGGLYQRPLPYGFLLDGYAQAGLVGLKSRDLFADGGITATRPMGRFALGGGLWGGFQPNVHRVDVGPRLSYRVSPSLRAHLDYRWRVSGRASPPSGPAVTFTSQF